MSFQRDDLRIKPRAGYVMWNNLKLNLWLLPFFLLFVYWLSADPSTMLAILAVVFFFGVPMSAFHARKICIRTRKGRVWVDPWSEKSADIVDLDLSHGSRFRFWRRLFQQSGPYVDRKGRKRFYVSRAFFGAEQVAEFHSYLEEYQQAIREARDQRKESNHV